MCTYISRIFTLPSLHPFCSNAIITSRRIHYSIGEIMRVKFSLVFTSADMHCRQWPWFYKCSDPWTDSLNLVELNTVHMWEVICMHKCLQDWGGRGGSEFQVLKFKENIINNKAIPKSCLVVPTKYWVSSTLINFNRSWSQVTWSKIRTQNSS